MAPCSKRFRRSSGRGASSPISAAAKASWQSLHTVGGSDGRSGRRPLGGTSRLMLRWQSGGRRKTNGHGAQVSDGMRPRGESGLAPRHRFWRRERRPGGPFYAGTRVVGLPGRPGREPVPEGLLRAVWRARRGISTIALVPKRPFMWRNRGWRRHPAAFFLGVNADADQSVSGSWRFGKKAPMQLRPFSTRRSSHAHTVAGTSLLMCSLVI